MSWFTSNDTIPVRLAECLCPGTPHPDGDVIEIRSELDLRAGLAVYARIAADDAGNLAENLARAWLRATCRTWSR